MTKYLLLHGKKDGRKFAVDISRIALVMEKSEDNSTLITVDGTPDNASVVNSEEDYDYVMQLIFKLNGNSKKNYAKPVAEPDYNSIDYRPEPRPYYNGNQRYGYGQQMGSYDGLHTVVPGNAYNRNGD